MDARTILNHANMKIEKHYQLCPVCEEFLMPKDQSIVAYRIVNNESNREYYKVTEKQLESDYNKIVVCCLYCANKVKKSWWWNDPSASIEVKQFRHKKCLEMIKAIKNE